MCDPLLCMWKIIFYVKQKMFKKTKQKNNKKAANKQIYYAWHSFLEQSHAFVRWNCFCYETCLPVADKPITRDDHKHIANVWICVKSHVSGYRCAFIITYLLDQWHGAVDGLVYSVTVVWSTHTQWWTHNNILCASNTCWLSIIHQQVDYGWLLLWRISNNGH